MRFFEEIANRESRNENEIVLYPEGLFYKAYDRSAFACVNRIPTFKPSKKRIKYCAREVASIGFPAAALAKYFPAAPRPLPDGRVVIVLKDRIDADACLIWKSSLPLRERRPRGTSKAYIAALGRTCTGNLFVHPADLLPDAPVAISTGTTGAEQPVLTTGGRGAVEVLEALNRGPVGSGPASREEPAGELLRERPEAAASGAGVTGRMAVNGGEARGTAAYAAAVGRVAAEAEQPGVATSGSYRPKWLRRLACKVLGISEIMRDNSAVGNVPARETAADPGLRPQNGRTGTDPAPNVGDEKRRSADAAVGGEAARPESEAARAESEAARIPEGSPAPELRRRPMQPANGNSFRPNAAGRNETREERVARLIREFRLEASTPVECVLFVADLKKEIDGYL